MKIEIPCPRHPLSSPRPLVMGVLNMTPDSFFDGSRQAGVAEALRTAEQMVADGADIIDVGGESTRPGAPEVSVADELDRVIPVIEALSASLDVPVSVDTSKAEVMTAAAEAGAELINDVCALGGEGAAAAAAATGLPVCLMHMQGTPRTMQASPEYEDVVAEVSDFLTAAADRAMAAGVARERIVLDPGFGFGKTLEHNLELLRGLPHLAELGFPVLIGLSRKSMIGQILGNEVADRQTGSIALALAGVERGAGIVRVHDVKETVEAIRIIAAIGV